MKQVQPPGNAAHDVPAAFGRLCVETLCLLINGIAYCPAAFKRPSKLDPIPYYSNFQVAFTTSAQLQLRAVGDRRVVATACLGGLLRLIR